MTEYFKVLSDSEFEQLKDAIALITVYIAGADGEIDADETKWAEKIAKIRSYNLPEGLAGFYKEIGVDFHEKLENYMTTLSELETRNKTVAEALTAINPILAKLPNKLAAPLYDSFKSFALHVAKSSGGFLGFFSVGPKEAALLDLEMITPIILDEEDEA